MSSAPHRQAVAHGGLALIFLEYFTADTSFQYISGHSGYKKVPSALTFRADAPLNVSSRDCKGRRGDACGQLITPPPRAARPLGLRVGSRRRLPSPLASAPSPSEMGDRRGKSQALPVTALPTRPDACLPRGSCPPTRRPLGLPEVPGRPGCGRSLPDLECPRAMPCWLLPRVARAPSYGPGNPSQRTEGSQGGVAALPAQAPPPQAHPSHRGHFCKPALPPFSSL